jgi:hypothetical protein
MSHVCVCVCVCVCACTNQAVPLTFQNSRWRSTRCSRSREIKMSYHVIDIIILFLALRRGTRCSRALGPRNWRQWYWRRTRWRWRRKLGTGNGVEQQRKRSVGASDGTCTVSKETYYSVKRDLLQCHKRPISHATCIHTGVGAPAPRAVYGAVEA